jgi:hypothetical protein
VFPDRACGVFGSGPADRSWWLWASSGLVSGLRGAMAWGRPILGRDPWT